MGNKLTLPCEGVYVSKTDPSLRITVTEVEYIGDEDDSPDNEFLYLVRWIEGEDEDDMSAMEFELDLEEWNSFVKAEQLEFDRDPYMEGIPEGSSLARLRDMLAQVKKE